MPITVLELATFRLGRDASTGDDFEQAGLPILGGCGCCGAVVGAYNACPSKSGYLKCRTECIGDDGWDSVEEANKAIFGEKVTSSTDHIESKLGYPDEEGV